MERNKLTNEELVDIVENEGLGYAIMCYLDPESIEDDIVRKLWSEAKQALSDLSEELKID